MGEGAFNTKSFDEVSGECALKQVAAQGMKHLAVVTPMYTVVASLLEGILSALLEIRYHSSEPHVMVNNVIASRVLDLHKDKYIKFDDRRGSQEGRRHARRIQQQPHGDGGADHEGVGCVVLPEAAPRLR